MPKEGGIPLPRAEIIALFLESLVFGALTVLYGISLWILLYRDPRRGRTRLNKSLFATSTIMFVLAIAHLAIDLDRAIQGFIVHGETPGGTELFYSQLSHPTHVAKSVIYITQTLVGDAFVTYRLYVVWNRMWWITIAPGLLLLGTAVSGYGICVVLTQLKGVDAIFANRVAPWITAFFSLSLTTNVLATLLITARIVYSNQKVKEYRASLGTYWGVLETIIQSAAIYSAALISLLATYAAGSNAQYICLDSLQPLIGVVFSLIIIRVGLSTQTTGSGDKYSSSVSAAPAPERQSVAPRDYAMRPLAINVSVTRTHDRASFEAYDRKDNLKARGGVAAADMESL